MAKKYTYDEVKAYMESIGLVLISTEYNNNKEKLDLKCSCGNIFKRSFQDVKNKKAYTCTECSGNKLSYSYVSNYIASKGCKLLSKQYTNNATKLDIECVCGNIYSVGFNTFKKGQTRCKKCYWKENKHHNALTYEEVKEYILTNSNTKLLSLEYDGVFGELDLLCHCGEVFTAKFSAIRKMKTIQCKKCTIKKNSDAMRYSWDFVKKEVEKNLDENFEVVGCDYTNTKSPIYLKHLKCGHIFKRTIGGIKYTNNLCPNCESPVRPKTPEEVQNFIDSLSTGFTVTRYVNTENIYLKHNLCGFEFKKRYKSIKDSGGVRCPSCNPLDSVGVVKILQWLDKNKIKYIREKSFKNCKNIRVLYFDFYLVDFNACIEFDGLQHFKPSSIMGGVENFNKTQKRDKIKNIFCEENGINLLRIKYNEANNIEEILENYINTLTPR